MPANILWSILHAPAQSTLWNVKQHNNLNACKLFAFQTKFMILTITDLSNMKWLDKDQKRTFTWWNVFRKIHSVLWLLFSFSFIISWINCVYAFIFYFCSIWMQCFSFLNAMYWDNNSVSKPAAYFVSITFFSLICHEN